jgi:inorganic pyrophosphatase
MSEFSSPEDFLNHSVTVTIDRPLGSSHPTHSFYYPINYGYLKGVILENSDGDELDAYVLGVFEPLTEFTGECIAVIHRTDDMDDKLVVVPPGRQFSDEQILALTEFQERFFHPVILRG